MTRRKLNISELQNTKTKNTIFFEDPQNDKKKIKHLRTSKYKRKKTLFFFETHKMTRRKLNISELQTTKTKNTFFF
jgi:hypothetical protein